ncbi:MAG: hypothetical protein V4751_07410 [Pseudomonadota bacterium]
MLSKILLLLGTLTMTGCLFTVDSDRQVGSSQWSSAQAHRIEPGETTQIWVQETFGEPARRTEYADGSEVWHYENNSKVETEVGLFLLFHVDVENEVERTLSVAIKEGVVTDYWTDSSQS